jgi:phage/plasmid-associated DNA primase
VLASLEQRGVRLLITEDQLWRCDDGIWSLPINGARHSIEMEIETVCDLNNIGTEIKLINEVRAWIMRQPKLYHNKVAWDDHGKIPVKNELLDRKTLKREPLTPEHYATWCLDVEYDPKAECPWWLRGLNDALADRPDDVKKQHIDLLQEISGVSLLDDKPKALSKALILVGDSNSGKTTIIEVLSGLHTDDPIATSLDMLSGSHGTMDFRRRAPWTLHEAFDGGKWHPSATIKLIFSGDPFPINIKNGPIINRRFTQPAYWGSNSPVQIREPTSAMRNRVIIIGCRQEFKDDELIGMGKEAARLGFENPHQMILKNEKAGLLNWSLAGMQRAMKEKRFTKIKEIEETLDEFRIDSNLAATFLNDCVKYGPDYRIRVTDFCAAFSVHWIQNKDSDQPVPGNDRIMRAVKLFGDKRIAIGKDLRDNTYRYICGVHLKPVALKYWEVAVLAERMNSTMASKIAQTSQDKTQVNRIIPPEWDTKELIIRLRIADFLEEEEFGSSASKKPKI